MSFVLDTPNELHTIDVDDPSDPSLVSPETEQKSVGEGQHNHHVSQEEPPLVVNMVKGEDDESSESEDESDAYNSESDGDTFECDGNNSESSDESEDDGSDDPDDRSDGAFEYHEVIDDVSKSAHDDVVHDEDLGGEAMATASAIAGVSVMSGFRGKRTLIIGVVLAAITACAIYFIWRKMQDMKKKICQLEQQQEMGLNDRDVQLISSQVLQDYLQQEPEEEIEPRIGETDRLQSIPECSDDACPDDALSATKAPGEPRGWEPAGPVETTETAPASPEPEPALGKAEPEAREEPAETGETAPAETASPEPPPGKAEPEAREEPVETREPATAETASQELPPRKAEPAAPEAAEEPHVKAPVQPSSEEPAVIHEDVPVREIQTKRRSRRSKGVD